MNEKEKSKYFFYDDSDDPCCEKCMGKMVAEGYAEWKFGNLYVDESEARPLHCYVCGVFLENDLSVDGFLFVIKTIAKQIMTDQVETMHVGTWARFYLTGKAAYVHQEVAYMAALTIERAINALRNVGPGLAKIRSMPDLVVPQEYLESVDNPPITE